jgi:Tfp pilus assembly protein PilN
MIKINLLESVTDKPIAASTVVEKKVSSPMTRLMLMVFAVGALALAFIAWDVIGSHWQQSAITAELDEQKQKAASLEVVMKEQQELEKKIKAIDTRIEAIKKLRSTQAGPSAVLESVYERLKSVSGVYLESIDQKGDVLTIVGDSPDEGAVTQFGRSLEFSSGLFSNLNIETQRKEVVPALISNEGAVQTPAVETVRFTIRCNYNPSKSGSPNTLQANNNGQPNGTNPQVANNAQPQPAQNTPSAPPAKPGAVQSN